MKDVNNEIRRVIEATPKSFSTLCKYFTCPISIKDSVDESLFPDFEFYYSKYIDKETMYLSERFYKDEDLFM